MSRIAIEAALQITRIIDHAIGQSVLTDESAKYLYEVMREYGLQDEKNASIWFRDLVNAKDIEIQLLRRKLKELGA